MALDKDRDTKERDGKLFNGPVGAGVKIFAGALIALNATGFLVPGSEDDALVAAGRADENVDNTDGGDGDVTVSYRKGCFRFDNSGAGDLIARTEIGSDCYIVDDATVAKTDNAAARSVAGKVAEVDDAGVWVTIS